MSGESSLSSGIVPFSASSSSMSSSSSFLSTSAASLASNSSFAALLHPSSTGSADRSTENSKSSSAQIDKESMNTAPENGDGNGGDDDSVKTGKDPRVTDEADPETGIITSSNRIGGESNFSSSSTPKTASVTGGGDDGVGGGSIIDATPTIFSGAFGGRDSDISSSSLSSVNIKVVELVYQRLVNILLIFMILYFIEPGCQKTCQDRLHHPRLWLHYLHTKPGSFVWLCIQDSSRCGRVLICVITQELDSRITF